MFPVDHIRKICKLRDTNLAEVERNTGIANGTIAKWENSPRSPQFDHLLKISRYLNCSIEELYLGEIKNPVTESDREEYYSDSDDRHEYINGIFDQLNFENQIRAANGLLSLLHRQQDLDETLESD